MAEFTTEAEMEKLFSTAGLDLRVDEDGTGSSKTAIVNQAIAWASSTIEAYTARFYESSNILSNQWIRSHATVLACYYFSQRRGNPSLFQRLADIAREDLTKLAKSEILIPGAVPISANQPALSNYNVDCWYGPTKAKVDIGTRVGEGYENQPTDSNFPYPPFP